MQFLFETFLFTTSERSNWWDAGFVYGKNSTQLNGARTKVDGKVLVSDIPCALAERDDGTYLAGDNKNSWVGVALLQDLFLKEHNWIAQKIKEEEPNLKDQEIFVRQHRMILE